jgi:hypothetical protein
MKFFVFLIYLLPLFSIVFSTQTSFSAEKKLLKSEPGIGILKRDPLDVDPPDITENEDGTRDPFPAPYILTPILPETGESARLLDLQVRIRFAEVSGADAYSVIITDSVGDRIPGTPAIYGIPFTAIDYQGSELQAETEYKIIIHIFSGENSESIQPQSISFTIVSPDERTLILEEIQRIEGLNISEEMKLEEQINLFRSYNLESEVISHLCHARSEEFISQIAQDQLEEILQTRFDHQFNLEAYSLSNLINLTCADPGYSFPSTDE